VLLTFDSNWERAKHLLTAVAEEAGRDVAVRAERDETRGDERFLIHYRSFSPRVYTSVTERGILLTMRLLAEPRHERQLQEAVWEAVLRTLADCDDIALANSGRQVVRALPGPEAGVSTEGAR